VSVQIKILSEKIAVEASRGARWRPPLFIFHRVVLSNFSTQAPVHEVLEEGQVSYQNYFGQMIYMPVVKLGLTMKPYTYYFGSAE
jgi:hypothetical protein